MHRELREEKIASVESDANNEEHQSILPKKLSKNEIITAQLNAITFEDIQKMHYSLLNTGSQKKDQFDPRQIIDIDSDDEQPYKVKPINVQQNQQP